MEIIPGCTPFLYENRFAYLTNLFCIQICYEYKNRATLPYRYYIQNVLPDNNYKQCTSVVFNFHIKQDRILLHVSF